MTPPPQTLERPGRRVSFSHVLFVVLAVFAVLVAVLAALPRSAAIEPYLSPASPAAPLPQGTQAYGPTSTTAAVVVPVSAPPSAVSSAVSSTAPARGAGPRFDPAVWPPSAKLFGMYADGWPSVSAAWEEAVGSLGGVRPSAQMWFVRLGDRLDGSWLTRSHDMGALPVLSVEPCFFGSLPDEGACALSNIVRGDFDDDLTDLAVTVRDSGVVVAVRFAHEMNGSWYPWGTVGSNTPELYVEAWRHTHRLFDAVGADNVIWVWSVNITSAAAPMAEFYPGDEWVDWLGISGFFLNFDPNPQAPLSPDYQTLLGGDIDAMRQFSDLPVLITETGADGAGGQKERFITDFLAAAAADDDVIGFIWYNKPVPPWRSDVRFNSTQAALDAFAAGLFSGGWALNLTY